MNLPKATINVTAWICQEDVTQKSFLPALKAWVRHPAAGEDPYSVKSIYKLILLYHISGHVVYSPNYTTDLKSL